VATRVLLADDHAAVRDGLRLLLEARGTIEVVGEAADGLTALRLAQELAPDVLVADIAMPGLNGIEVAQRLRDLCPSCRVVVLSMHGTAEHVFRALRAGVIGYVLKESAGRHLVAAVEAARQGRRHLDPAVAAMVGERELSHARGEASPLESLSAWEREVLQLVAEGWSSSQVGERLFLSPKTVETYRARLMRKLGVGNVAELVKFAVAHGVIAPG